MNIEKPKIKKKKNRSALSKLMLFLAFEIVFSLFTMPLLIFYGPFENVRNNIVGMSINSLHHQQIARFFLSDIAINRILGSTSAVDPTAHGEELKTLNFGVNHTDKIDVYKIESSGISGKMMIVYDPTSLKVGYSEQLPKSGETTSFIAKRNNAIAAINAGGFMDKGWSGTGGTPTGFIMHDGKVLYNQYKSEKIKQDTIAFTDEGMLIVGTHSIEDLKSYNVMEGVSFGPPLIVNGKPTITKGDGGWGIAPRTAIGQRENGEVLLLVIDGRSWQSFGATLKDIQDILLQYGAVNAANLDGGASTTMFFNGSVINQPSDSLGERAVPSVFMVVSKTGGG